MPNDTRRGIGAVLIALGGIGLLLWLAVARLAPDTVFGPVGGAVAVGLLALIGVGVGLVRRRT